MGWRYSIFVFLLAGMTAVPAVAADVATPGALQNTIRNADELYQRQELEDLKQRQQDEGDLVNPGQEPRPAASGNGAKIRINRIVVGPSQILSAAEINQVTDKYQGKLLTLSGLNRMLDEINRLYRDKNFITARAVLPRQKVVNGVIHVKLVEATLDRVIVENNRHTRKSYITDRMDLASGELADINKLEDELVWFNQRNDISLRATLKPGAEPGTTSYYIDVREPKNLAAYAFADNAGRETIGRNRIGAVFTDNSLTGHRDKLSLGATYAEGTRSVNISYSVPINRYGTRLVAGYDYSDIAIISGGLAALNIKGQSSITGLALRHPLYFSRGHSTYGVVGFEAKESTTDFNGVQSFTNTQRVFTLGLDMQDFADGRIWYAQPRIKAGVDEFGGDQSYTYLYGDAAAIFGISSSDQLLLRMRLQLSAQNGLPASEQFQLGGTASVRGYDEGQLIGDEGYFTSIEYRFGGLPMTALGLPDATLSPLVFLDHGGVASKGEENQHEYLTSTGFGVSARYSDRFGINAQIGIPLDPPGGIGDSYRVHLQLKYTPL